MGTTSTSSSNSATFTTLTSSTTSTAISDWVRKVANDQSVALNLTLASNLLDVLLSEIDGKESMADTISKDLWMFFGLLGPGRSLCRDRGSLLLALREPGVFH